MYKAQLLYKHIFIFRFSAEDPDSGRRDYFISRNIQVDLTEITTKSIRIQDPR